MTTAVKLNNQQLAHTSALTKVSTDRDNEDQALNEIYEAMGWGDLPYRLKFEIALDVVGFYDELRGMYSTRDPFVLARRKRVIYWINNYRAGNCSLQTILNALKIKN
ncbi:MAG TPA: hypothetical protein VKA34_14925 [Balneolales bacterium]|nr:hypothetical protein [Balneolales bacterium]